MPSHHEKDHCDGAIELIDGAIEKHVIWYGANVIWELLHFASKYSFNSERLLHKYVHKIYIFNDECNRDYRTTEGA